MVRLIPSGLWHPEWCALAIFGGVVARASFLTELIVFATVCFGRRYHHEGAPWGSRFCLDTAVAPAKTDTASTLSTRREGSAAAVPPHICAVRQPSDFLLLLASIDLCASRVPCCIVLAVAPSHSPQQ